MNPKYISTLSLSEQLQLFPIFQNLDKEILNEIVRKLDVRKYKKNQYIYQINDKAHSIHFLIEGNIKIGTLSGSGKEVIKSIIHPEAMFGEMVLFKELKRENFALCLESNTRVYELDAEFFKMMISKHIQLSANVISMIGKKLHFAEKRIESLVFKDARERIVDFLKDNAKNFGKQIGFEMLIKHSLTQQDIANFTGTSRQTVTSVLNDLKKSNQIYFKRKSILIRDMSTLS